MGYDPDLVMSPLNDHGHGFCRREQNSFDVDSLVLGESLDLQPRPAPEQNSGNASVNAGKEIELIGTGRQTRRHNGS
jgi:hypothetical protein